MAAPSPIHMAAAADPSPLLSVVVEGVWVVVVVGPTHSHWPHLSPGLDQPMAGQAWQGRQSYEKLRKK